MLRPFTPIVVRAIDCEACDRVVTRNAALIVALKHIALEGHAVHAQGHQKWWHCPLFPCKAVVQAIGPVGS